MSAEFEEAAARVKDLQSLPSNEELLDLYGYFKQVELCLWNISFITCHNMKCFVASTFIVLGRCLILLVHNYCIVLCYKMCD